MAERYTSRIALRLGEDVAVDEVVGAAVEAGDVDRASPVRGEGALAQEVHWGGRTERGVVRRLAEGDDLLLRTEVDLAGAGPEAGLARQARLLQALTRQLGDRVTRVVDLSARIERDRAWMNRAAVGAVELDDAVAVHHDVSGDWLWVLTHGAARLEIPDLELYGLGPDQREAAGEAVRHVHGQLLAGGLGADLELPGGRAVYLVPVLEAWSHLPLDWPGVGEAGEDRGPGLDGPRATLSLLHPPRLGRYRTDLRGVLEALGDAGV